MHVVRTNDINAARLHGFGLIEKALRAVAAEHKADLPKVVAVKFLRDVPHYAGEIAVQ